MGKTLANEIHNFIAIKRLNQKNLKINLIGHSLGGIILRTSLKYIKPIFLEKMNIFLSLASPHAGIGAK